MNEGHQTVSLPRVSVIVPVYNTAPWLKRCLDSLVTQTLKEIEIICVNDGSTDGALSILREYAVRDGRVRVIDQTNQGVSVARNVGVEAAIGAYLMFVDSDDWVEPDFCRAPYEIAQNSGAEIVAFGYWKESAENSAGARGCIIDKWWRLEEDEARIQLVTQGGNIWDKLWLRGLWIENGLFFPEGMHPWEDSFAQCMGVMFAHRLSQTDLRLYHYRDRPGSATKSQGWDRSLTVAPEMIRKLRERLANDREYPRYRRFIAALSLTLYRSFYLAMPAACRKEGAARVRGSLTNEDWAWVKTRDVVSWPRRLFYDSLRGYMVASVLNWVVMARVRLLRKRDEVLLKRWSRFQSRAR